MASLPTFSFSFYESATNASSTWPIAAYFPKNPAGIEFSIENALPKQAPLQTLTIVLLPIVKADDRVIH